MVNTEEHLKTFSIELSKVIEDYWEDSPGCSEEIENVIALIKEGINIVLKQCSITDVVLSYFIYNLITRKCFGYNISEEQKAKITSIIDSSILLLIFTYYDGKKQEKLIDECFPPICLNISRERPVSFRIDEDYNLDLGGATR